MKLINVLFSMALNMKMYRKIRQQEIQEKTYESDIYCI